MKVFAVRIRQLRLNEGLSQDAVAKALGMTKNALCNYEAGIREPSLETLVKICHIFNVSADYLLGLSDQIKI